MEHRFPERKNHLAHQQAQLKMPTNYLSVSQLVSLKVRVDVMSGRKRNTQPNWRGDTWGLMDGGKTCTRDEVTQRPE